MSREKEIVLLSATPDGHEHDLLLLKKSELPDHIPKEVTTYMDLGFKGIEKQ